MVAWAAILPALKAVGTKAMPVIAKVGQKALPYVGKALGASGSLFGSFGGNDSEDSSGGSGITYNPQVYGGQVQTNGFTSNNNLYPMLTGEKPKNQGLSFYDRLVN